MKDEPPKATIDGKVLSGKSTFQSICWFQSYLTIIDAETLGIFFH